jgi:hypothetical protein
MFILIGLLSLIITIYIFSLIGENYPILKGLWVLFGLGITSISLVWIFSAFGVRINGSSSTACEVDYSQKGIASVICDD